MGGFKMELTGNKEPFKNEWTSDRPGFTVDGHKYEYDEYVKILTLYLKRKMQYDQLENAREEAEKTIARENSQMGFASMLNKNEAKDAVLDSKNSINKAEKQIETIDPQLEKLSKKLVILKAQLDKYNSNALGFVKQGANYDHNIKLKFSNDRFLEYLALIECRNVKINNDEEAQNTDALIKQAIEDVAGDFNIILPRLLGTEQEARLMARNVNPLRFLMVDGVSLDRYTFDFFKMERPTDKNGKALTIVQLSKDKTYNNMMKAAFMSALVSGKHEVRILELGDYKTNFHYMNPRKIVVDVSEYKPLEEQWIKENKKNFEEPVENVCVDGRKPDPEYVKILENASKSTEAYRNTDKKDKAKFLADDVEARLNKVRKSYDDAIKAYIDSLNSGIDEVVKMGDAINHFNNLEEKGKQDLDDEYKQIMGDKTYYSDVSTDMFEYKVGPMDEDTKNSFEKIIATYRSANMAHDPNNNVEDVVNALVEMYNNAKDEASNALKTIELTNVYSDILDSKKIFRQGSVALTMYKRAKNVFSEALKADKKMKEVNVSTYVQANNKVLGIIMRSFEELNNIKVGSYHKLNGNNASEDVINIANSSLLDPGVLGHKEKEEFERLHRKLKSNLREAKKKNLKLIEYTIDATAGDKKIMNLTNAELESVFDINEIKRDYIRLTELYGKMLFKSNGLEVPVPTGNNKIIKLDYDSYNKAQSKLYYVREIVSNVREKLLADCIEPGNPVSIAKIEQDEVLNKLKGKQNYEIIDARLRYLTEHNLNKSYNTLTKILDDYEKQVVNKDYAANKLTSEGKPKDKENLRVLEDELKVKYPANYDKEIVEANNKRLGEQGKAIQTVQRKTVELKVDGSDVDISDEEIEKIINESIKTGNTSILEKNLKVDAIKKRYDDLIKEKTKELTEADKAQIAIKINEKIRDYIPKDILSEYNNVDLSTYAAVKKLYDKHLDALDAQTKDLNIKRKEARLAVVLKTEEINSLEFDILSAEEISEYWGDRIKTVKTIVKDNDELEDKEKQYQTFHRKHDSFIPRHEKLMELSAQYDEELAAVSQFMDPSGKWASKLKINDLKNASTERSLVDLQYMSEDSLGEGVNQIEALNQNRTLRFADLLGVPNGLHPKTKDLHRRGKSLNGYDKMTVEEFLKLYQEVRPAYGSSETDFARENPAMKARYDSIVRLLGKLSEERQNRQTIFDEINKARIETEVNMADAYKSMTYFKNEVDRLNQKIDTGIKEFAENVDSEIEGSRKNSVMDRETFLANADMFIQKADIAKKVVDENIAKLNVKLAEKKAGLEKLKAIKDKLYEETGVEKVSVSLLEMDRAFDGVEKNITKQYVIDKLFKKETKAKQKNKTREILGTYEERLSIQRKHYSDYVKNSRIGLNPGENNRGKKIAVFIQENSDAFRESMCALYDMIREGSSFHEGYKSDDAKLLGERRKILRKVYPKIVESMSSKELFGKEVVQSKNKNKIVLAKISDIDKAVNDTAQKYYLTASKNLQESIKAFCPKNKWEKLYSDLYPTAYRYVSAHREIEEIMAEYNLPKYKSMEEAKVFCVDGFDKIRQAANEDSDNYKAVKAIDKVLDKYGYDKQTGEEYLTDVFAGVNRLTIQDLQHVEGMCSALADCELNLMAGSVEEVLLSNEQRVKELTNNEIIK